jgi:hypothetical protein
MIRRQEFFMKNTHLVLMFLAVIVTLCSGCMTTDYAMAPSPHEYCTLKIVPGTIITEFNGVKLLKAWKGRYWQYRQLVTTIQIESGKCRLRAEAEFDPPIWLAPIKYPPKTLGTKPKIYVVDQDVSFESLPANLQDPNKYDLYRGLLTTTFNFEARHEYIAQVIIDEDEDFILHIWDNGIQENLEYPRRLKRNKTSKGEYYEETITGENRVRTTRID